MQLHCLTISITTKMPQRRCPQPQKKRRRQVMLPGNASKHHASNYQIKPYVA